MKVLDLLSNFGDVTDGLGRAGLKTIAFAETDVVCNSTLELRWPKIPNLGSVTKLCRRIYDCETIEDSDEVYCPRCKTEFADCTCIGTDQFIDEHGTPDIITVGYLNRLWPECARIVGELDPAWVIIDSGTTKRSNSLKKAITDLSALGYAPESLVLNRLNWIVARSSSLGAASLWPDGAECPKYCDTVSVTEMIGRKLMEFEHA